jgi:hypothetical protein
MPINTVQAWYFDNFPINLLDYFDIPENRTGGVKTGGMQPHRFQALKESIEQEGLINPVIVEYDNTRAKVQLGNNRCIAMLQLGHDTIKTIYCTKNGVLPPVPGGKPIPADKVDATMRVIHPGDTKYIRLPYLRNLRRHVQSDQPADWAK